MAFDRIDPGEQVSEADLLEQQRALDPPLTDALDIEKAGELAMRAVDAADLRGQHESIPTADDDYPHDAFEPGDLDE